MSIHTWLVTLAAVALACSGCSKEMERNEIVDNLLLLPFWIPEPPFQEENVFTQERWELGKKLFFDPSLSLNQTVSCGSCHLPSLAFSDSLPTSFGDLGTSGNTNAPPLFNLAYHPYYTRAGGVPSLEMQVAVPVQEHNEFNQNMVELIARLALNPLYEEASQIAYHRTFDSFTLTRALAVFERSLISGSSSYDRFSHLGEYSAMNPSAKRGMELFFSSKTNCSSCHSGFNFTSYEFENNGLYETYSDSGRMRITHLEEDRAKFKIPSLRNVAFTAPYMHDGTISTLQNVVAHYNSGGQTHANKSHLVRPLGLTETEQEDIVAFLNSLTDYSFIQNPNFRP